MDTTASALLASTLVAFAATAHTQTIWTGGADNGDWPDENKCSTRKVPTHTEGAANPDKSGGEFVTVSAQFRMGGGRSMNRPGDQR